MLLGHSSGGDVVIAIAERLKAANVPVALILGFDPTPIAGRIPSNVEMFINLYQATNLIGGGSACRLRIFAGGLSMWICASIARSFTSRSTSPT